MYLVIYLLIYLHLTVDTSNPTEHNKIVLNIKILGLGKYVFNILDEAYN